MQDFRNLQVWEKSHLLTLAIYRQTAAFPKSELYGLTSQLRRSAAAIPANLAEGCVRSTDKDFGRFAWVAIGSASEVDYHLLLARDLGYLTEEQYAALAADTTEVKRMLASLIRKLKAES